MTELLTLIKYFWMSKVQPAAQSSIISEVRPGCAEMCQVESWKPLRPQNAHHQNISRQPLPVLWYFAVPFSPTLMSIRTPLASIQSHYLLFCSWACEIPVLWPWQKPVRDWEVDLTHPQSFIFSVIKVHCLSFSSQDWTTLVPLHWSHSSLLLKDSLK